MASMVSAGGGKHCYAANSRIQRLNFTEFAQPFLISAVSAAFEAYLRHHGNSTSERRPFSAADLGCSHGPNAILYFSTIANELRCLISATTTASCDILYQFSDLPSNDFNSLFQAAVSYTTSLNSNVSGSGGDAAIKMFTAGVPGSFYDRLFPNRSLHLVVCGYSLHWLSQVPREVVEPASEAWNGGYVWLHPSRRRVVEAYARQSQEDLAAFWRCRAEEMASGAVLFLFALTRKWEDPPPPSPANNESGYLHHRNDVWMGAFQSAWDQLVCEGVISAEERDSFNVPSYNFHPNELQSSLSSFSHEFEVLELTTLHDYSCLDDDELQRLRRDPPLFGKFWAGFVASFTKTLVEKKVGCRRAELLFERMERVAAENASTATVLFDLLVLLLRRR